MLAESGLACAPPAPPKSTHQPGRFLEAGNLTLSFGGRADPKVRLVAGKLQTLISLNCKRAAAVSVLCLSLRFHGVSARQPFLFPAFRCVSTVQIACFLCLLCADRRCCDTAVHRLSQPFTVVLVALRVHRVHRVHRGTHRGTAVATAATMEHPIQNVTIQGLHFRDAADTTMEPWGVPSGGDW